MDENTLSSLVNAVGQRESQGDYSAVGKPNHAGQKAYGKYQVMDFNIPDWTKDATGTSMTPGDFLQNQPAQDAVAKKYLGKYLEQTGNPADAASMWFSGRTVQKAGQAQDVNGTTVPSYVQAIMGLMGGGVANAATMPDQSQPQQQPQQQGGQLSREQMIANINAMEQQGAQPQEIQSYLDSLGGSGGAAGTQNAPVQGTPQQPQQGYLPDVNKDVNQLSTNLGNRLSAASDAFNLASQGGIGNVAQGALRGVGAVAGGFGDIVNAGANLIPGVQMAEDTVGKIMGAAADTSLGRQIASGLSGLIQQHPDAAKDLGAVADIASVFPLFKGLSLATGAARDAAFIALKGNVEKAADTEVRNLVTTNIAKQNLHSAETRGLQPIKLILNDPALHPNIVEGAGGKLIYSTQAGRDALGASIDADEGRLDDLLRQAEKGKAGTLVDMNEVRAQTLKDIGKQYEMTGEGPDAKAAVIKYFDNVKESDPLGRNHISLEELNNLKRNVKKGAFNTLSDAERIKVRKAMGYSLRNQVIKRAKDAGIQGVEQLNKIMGEKLSADAILKNIDGKALKAIQTRGGAIAKEVGSGLAGLAGGAASRLLGLPEYASTLASRGLFHLASKAVPEGTALAQMAARKTILPRVLQGGKSIVKGLVRHQVGKATQGQ